MRPPKAYYDPRTDSLMIDLADGEGEEVVEVAENVMLTFDTDGNPVAIEFLGDVRDLLSPVIRQEFRAPADASQARHRAS